MNDEYIKKDIKSYSDKDINSNISANEKSDSQIISKELIARTTMEMIDLKKERFYFSLEDRVIDVGLDQYAVSKNGEHLVTYGIETCCGIVLSDETQKVLFHVSPSTNPENVIKITTELGLSESAKVTIAPGINCQFDYSKLIVSFNSLGYEPNIVPIPATYGHVMVINDEITIGTALDRNLDQIIDISQKKI